MSDAPYSPTLNSPTPSAGIPPPAQEPQSDVEQAQPRTLGGFVLEDDDAQEEEEEEEAYQPDEAISTDINYQQNVLGDGSPTTPQQDPASVKSPSSSRPQSTMNFPSMSNNVPEQSTSDTVPSSTSVAPVVSQGPGDNLVSPSAPSNNQTSMQNTSLLAPNVSRPSTANGVVHSPSTIVQNARLPLDRVGMLEDRIAADPKGDTEAWLLLIDEFKRRNKIKEMRDTYERFFIVFPTAADQWTAYATWELDNNNLYEAEQIFSKAIMSVPNVSFWKTYLNYVRRRYALVGKDADKNRSVVTQVFELVLKEVGIDKDAGQLWQDYIEFNRSAPGTIGGNSWQDQQKMDLMRKAFQQATSVPTSVVENLWREYDAFEMSLNKMTGRKFLQEKSADYMTARSAKIELQNLTHGLDRSTLPKLPPVPGYEGDVHYQQQVSIWEKWIAWEKEDPLEFKGDKPDEYRHRVLYVYKQATMVLRFWPDIWFEASEWCYDNGLKEDGDKFLDRGFAANPESCLLAFRQADRQESTTSSDETEESIKRRGDAVREPFDKVLNSLYELMKKAEERENREIARVREEFGSKRSKSPTNPYEGDDDDEQNSSPDQESQLQAQIDAISRSTKAHVQLCRKLVSSVWIALMRTMRRVQGKGKPGETIGGFRQIFLEARKRGKLNSEVYTEAALIEHYCYKDPAATKIFERGFKLHPEDENFAIEYIKHLIAINDLTNARAVFESAVNRLTSKTETKHKAKPVFALFHSHEALFGELDQIKKLEKRISTLYPEDPSLELFANRHTTQGFNPCSIRPVISPATQTKPKPGQDGFKRSPPMHNSPRAGLAALGMITNSPKRSLEESDSEMPPRKMQRPDSPLKGAAGRRLDAARKTALRNEVNADMSTPQPAPAPSLPPGILQLLQSIPSAHTYAATRFDPHKMVGLLRDIDLSSVDPSILQRPNFNQQPGPVTAAPPAQYPPQQYYGAMNQAYGYPRQA